MSLGVGGARKKPRRSRWAAEPWRGWCCARETSTDSGDGVGGARGQAREKRERGRETRSALGVGGARGQAREKRERGRETRSALDL